MALNTTAENRAASAQSTKVFASISLEHVRAEVSEALAHFGRSGFLEEYTKHDITHVDSMLDMYEWLIPADSKDEMTSADWLMLTLATYLHDFGLLVTRDEYDGRDKCEGFKRYRERVATADSPDATDYRAQLDRLGDQREAFLYQEFVRSHHAERIRSWLRPDPDPQWGFDPRITERLSKIFAFVDTAFMSDLGMICESHHLDDLGDVAKYSLNKPYGSKRDEEVNLQYIALMLRTADLLHITTDRVPAMAAAVVNPRNPKSQVEWAKQSAVRSVRAEPIDPERHSDPRDVNTIEVHATFSVSDGYFGLTQYLTYAQAQVKQSWEWAAASAQRTAQNYRFPWKAINTDSIKAEGFIAKPFRFTIDQGRILNLLTGHTLYNDSGVVVRELVQNALDAVRLQSHLLKGSSYEPRISVAWDSAERVLEITDNGVGMSQAVVEKNFLHVGASRYQSEEFKKTYPDFSSISRFGIGVLSAFMVADDVSVLTSSQDEEESRQLSLRDVHGQYLVQLLNKRDESIPAGIQEHGTRVRLQLRPSAELIDIRSLLRYWLLVPNCEITLAVDGGAAESIGFASVTAALEASLTASGALKSVEGGFTTAYGERATIETIHSDGVEIAYASSWSRWLEEWQFLRVDPNSSDDPRLIPLGVAIEGVRVTDQPPGFLSGGIAAMSNATGKIAPRTNVARSAIERNEDYERFLGLIYQAYIDHVGNEMQRMESSGVSASKAASEGAYLLGNITERYPIESEQIFNSKARSIPVFVVEDGEERSRRSLAELREVEEVALLEGPSVTSFEAVLSSVRDAPRISLRGLVRALGTEQGLQIPDQPLLAGRTGNVGRLGILDQEWEPHRFSLTGDGRVLVSYWRKFGDAPTWSTPRLPPGLPVTFLQRLDQFSRSGEALDSTNVRIAREDDVDLDGFEETVVYCQGKHYVTRDSPFLQVRSAATSVPEDLRIWMISWTIRNFLNTRSVRNSLNWVLDRTDDEPGPRSVELLRNLGVTEILDEAGLVEALSNAPVAVLDVHRWERRADFF